MSLRAVGTSRVGGREAAHIKTALDWAGLSSPPRLQRLEGGEEEDELQCVLRVGTVVVKSGSAQPRASWSDPGLLGLKS